MPSATPSRRKKASSMSAPTARPPTSSSTRRSAGAGRQVPEISSTIFRTRMSKPDSSEDLAAIVARGASRPVRKWFFIALGIAALAGGGWYYKSRDKDGPQGPEYITEPLEKGNITIEVTATG